MKTNPKSTKYRIPRKQIRVRKKKFSELKFLPKLIGLIVAGISLFVIFQDFEARAVNRTWDGGGTDGTCGGAAGDGNKWSCALNWSSDTVPGNADIAVFDGTSTKDATVDSAYGGTVDGINIGAGYSGTITLARNLGVESGHYIQAGGTFALSTFTLTFTIGGDFTKTGGNFNEDTGTVDFGGSAGNANYDIDVVTTETFYNLKVSAANNSLDIATGDTLVVTGTLTQTQGRWIGGTIDFQGANAIQTSGAQETSSTVFLFGSVSAQTYTIQGGAGPLIRLDHSDDASDSIVLSASGSIQGLDITSGFSGTVPLTYNGFNLTLLGNGLSQAAGTFIAPAATLKFMNGGDFIKTGGSFEEGTGTVDFGGSGGNANYLIDSNITETFHHVIVSAANNSATIQTGETIIVIGNITMTQGAFNGGTIDWRGSTTTQTTDSQQGTSVFLFNSASAQTYTVQGGMGPILTLDEANDANDSVNFTGDGGWYGINITSGFSGTVPFTYNGNDLNLSSAGFIQAAGTFNTPSATMNFTNGASLTQSGGTFNSNGAGTIVIGTGGSSGHAIDAPGASGTITFHHLQTNIFNGSLNSSDTIIMTGNLTQTNGPINSGTYQVQGNVTIATGAQGGSGVLHFTGNGTQLYTDQGGDEINGDITVNKTGGTITLASNADWNSSSQDLNVTAGTFSQGATFTLATGAVTVGATGVWTNTGTGDVTLGGNVSNSGTITLDGSGSGCGGADAITINSTASTKRIWSGNGIGYIADTTVSNMGGVIRAVSSTNTTNNNWMFVICTDYTQSTYRWYANADSATPGAALAAENATAIGSAGTPIRLRSNTLIGSVDLSAASAQYKLQIGTSTSGPWIDVNPSWWNASWLNRRQITFDNTSSAENLVDFTVLVPLNSTNIDYSKTQNSGQDIRFVDSDGTLLNHEIETWDETGTSYVWVKVPQINSASITDYIWVYYNNTGASDGQNVSAAWDSNYVSVWHMDETSGTTITDSKATNNGTKVSASEPAALSSGQVNGAQDFDGSNDYINVPDSASLDLSTAVTVSTWMRPDDSANEFDRVLVKAWATDVAPWYTYGFQRTASAQTYSFCIGTTTSINRCSGSTSSAVVGEWTHLAGTYNGTNTVLYFNSNAQGASNNGSALNMQTNNIPVTIGRNHYNREYFNAGMDEVRISNVARSADWMEAEYKTMIQAMNFYGAEETYGVITGFHNNATPSDGTTLGAVTLSNSNVVETYEEGNPTILNPNQISVGQRGEWDHVLDLSNLSDLSTYYFRMVNFDGTALTSYSNYPTLSMVNNLSPSTPTSLGPASYVDGSWDNDNTPTLTFSLSDPDVGNTVKYQIQIDDTSNFSSPVVDYTSALAAQGAASFTVGQATGSGTYTTGSAGQTLSDSSSYYWRVKTIDAAAAESSYATANSGSIAFKIDTVAPTSGTASIGSTGNSFIVVQISSAADPLSGLASSPYLFQNTTNSTNSGQQSATSWTSSGLASGTSYSFNVIVTDIAGNTSTTSTVSGTTTSTGGGGGGGQAPPPPPPPAPTPTPVPPPPPAPTPPPTPTPSPTPSPKPKPTPTPTPVPSPTPTPVPPPAPLPTPTPTPVPAQSPTPTPNPTPTPVPAQSPTPLPSLEPTCPKPDEKAINKTYRDSIRMARDEFAKDIRDARLIRQNTINQAKNLSKAKRKEVEKAADQTYNQSRLLALKERGQSNASALSVRTISLTGQCLLPPPIPLEEDNPPVTPPVTSLDQPPGGSSSSGSSSSGNNGGSSTSSGSSANPAISSFTSNVLNFLAQTQASIVVGYFNYTPPTPQDVVDTSLSSRFLSPLATIAAIPISLALSSSTFQMSLLQSAGIFDFVLLITRYWLSFLGIIGLRKARRPWGTVFDSITKQPLDPVLVSLLDAKSGKVLERAITDLNGRFGFLARSGRFMIDVKKTHYIFPSRHITSDNDSIYSDIYTGGVLGILNDSQVVAPNIPMDPLAFDWNQEAKKAYVQVNPNFQIFVNTLFFLLFWGGLIFTLATTLALPSWINIALLSIYCLTVAYKLLRPRVQLYGQIKNNNNRSMKLELNYDDLPNSPVVTSATLPNGRFFMKANPDRYTLRVRDLLTDKLVLETPVQIGKEHVLNKRISIKQ